MNSFLEVKDLSYLNIFKNFSIKIEKNKLISISGPNNCGKTTLLRILDRQISVDDVVSINSIKQYDYKITDYCKIVKTVIPTEFTNIFDTVENEINYCIDQLFLSKEEKSNRLKSIYKYLNITKIKKAEINSLTESDFVRLQIAMAIASMPKLLLIDDISPYFTTEEIMNFIKFFKKIISVYDLTIVMVSKRLDDLLDTDYLYILHDGNILLEGKPIEVLQKDNTLNKIGLQLPFMIDLSVKLKDYGLIENIELDMNRMADTLWK